MNNPVVALWLASHYHPMYLNSLMFWWLIVAVIFLLLEIGNPGLFLHLAFCFAALGSAKAAYFGANVLFQLLVFIIGFVVSFGLLSWFAKRITHNAPRTNVYALEGQQGRVISAIFLNNSGQVKINGEIWTAKSIYNDGLLAEGVLVQVVSVRGAHLVVQKVFEKNNII